MPRTISRRASTCASEPPSSPAPRMATSIMRVGYCNGAMKKELHGQAALVTGGSRGIGFGIAQAFVKHGVNVAITGRDESSLAEARRRLAAVGPGRVETHAVDVCNAALPALRQRGGGYIFNISSLAGKNPFIGAGAYCASKAALNQFSEVLNQEVRHDNIKVTTIAP